MGFNSTKSAHVLQLGDQRMVSGTFTNDGGSTGGIISTGLHYVTNLLLQHNGASAVTEAPTVKTALETIGGVQRLPPNIEIVCTADKNGIWTAIGA